MDFRAHNPNANPNLSHDRNRKVLWDSLAQPSEKHVKVKESDSVVAGSVTAGSVSSPSRSPPRSPSPDFRPVSSKIGYTEEEMFWSKVVLGQREAVYNEWKDSGGMVNGKQMLTGPPWFKPASPDVPYRQEKVL